MKMRLMLLVLVAPTAVAQQSDGLAGRPSLPAPLGGVGQTLTGTLGTGRGPLEPRWGPDAPEDSSYRAARETLNRGEYRKAAEQFANFAQQYPASRYRAAATYWQAFALYRVGAEPDLRRALGLLENLKKASDAGANEAEVKALVTRLVGALAARGDQAAVARLREGDAQGQAPCDQEDIEVRVEALAALVQNDPAGAPPLLRRILARRDECTVPLRRRAIYVLGKDADPSRVNEVVEVAGTDPSPEVRSDAIARLAQIPGDRATKALERFLTPGSDERTQRAVVRALRGRDEAVWGRVIRRVVEAEEYSPPVRIEAIWALAECCPRQPGQGGHVGGQLGQTAADGPRGNTNLLTTAGSRPRPALSDDDRALLRRVFERSRTPAIREAIIEVAARSAGGATDPWILGLIRNPAEDLRLRSTALSRLHHADTPTGDLAKLYDTLTERELRRTLVQILGQREDDGATDKLVEIARTGTDPVVRRAAISVLTRRKDARSTKLLLELVEK